MPRVIRRMADPAMGGSILEVIEFILSWNVGRRGTETSAQAWQMFFALLWTRVGEVALVDGGYGVAKNGLNVDEVVPVF